MDLFNKYVEEIKEDTKLDDFNIKQVQLILPTKKHYWATKLIIHKKELNDLIKKRETLINSTADKLIETSNVVISRATALNKVKQSDAIKKIDNDIQELNYVIELLEKAEQIFKSMSFDIKNIIEINKLEQL